MKFFLFTNEEGPDAHQLGITIETVKNIDYTKYYKII